MVEEEPGIFLFPYSDWLDVSAEDRHPCALSPAFGANNVKCWGYNGESPGTSPADEALVVLDFATPQRAVAIQFGPLCNEEAGCESPQGQHGVDAAGIELWAFDERHFPIVTATVPINWDETIVEGRTDYLIGLRDAAARIHRVELRLGVENFKTGRCIPATAEWFPTIASPTSN